MMDFTIILMIFCIATTANSISKKRPNYLQGLPSDASVESISDDHIYLLESPLAKKVLKKQSKLDVESIDVSSDQVEPRLTLDGEEFSSLGQQQQQRGTPPFYYQSQGTPSFLGGARPFNRGQGQYFGDASQPFQGQSSSGFPFGFQGQSQFPFPGQFSGQQFGGRSSPSPAGGRFGELENQSPGFGSDSGFTQTTFPILTPQQGFLDLSFPGQNVQNSLPSQDGSGKKTQVKKSTKIEIRSSPPLSPGKPEDDLGLQNQLGGSQRSGQLPGVQPTYLNNPFGYPSQQFGTFGQFPGQGQGHSHGGGGSVYIQGGQFNPNGGSHQPFPQGGVGSVGVSYGPTVQYSPGQVYPGQGSQGGFSYQGGQTFPQFGGGASVGGQSPGFSFEYNPFNFYSGSPNSFDPSGRGQFPSQFPSQFQPGFYQGTPTLYSGSTRTNGIQTGQGVSIPQRQSSRISADSDLKA